MKNLRFLLLSIFFAGKVSGADYEIEGEIEFEARGFLNDPSYQAAKKYYASISSLIEFGVYNKTETHALIFKAFARGDSSDSRRSHGDLREAKYRYVNGDFELTLGVDKVFWGVAEFLHLVDIINQTDFVESFDGEQKLGQSMLRASYVSPIGTLTGFFMPNFNPRNFLGSDGRPNGGFLVDTNREYYESSDGKNHDDFAFRYSHNFYLWDFGLSYFKGTSREPILTNQSLLDGLVVPYYPQREQVSLDIQATIDSWLLKIEALKQREVKDSTGRFVAGLEYTFHGILNSFSDLGIVAEYMWDERKLNAPHLFNDDFGIGLRWTLNDTNSTTVLIGAILDLETSSSILLVEAESRLSNRLKMSFELRSQINTDIRDTILFATKDEGFIRCRLTYYF